VEAQHVAQHQRGALARREVLQGRHEPQSDRLPGLVARLRAGRGVRHPLQQDVEIRLQPDRLGPASGLGRLDHRWHLLGAAPEIAQRVQAAVGRDAVQPRAQRGSPLEAPEPAPGRQQRLLQQVLGILDRAEDPVAVELKLAPVGIDELAERLLVARAGADKSLIGLQSSSSMTSSSGFHHG
jgi:hypothetical protein